MIWVTDATGQTTYICSEWYAFTGLRPPAALGSGWASAIHPEDRDLMTDTFQQACVSQCEFVLHYRLRRYDGSYVWVIDSAAPAWLPKRKAFLGYLGQISSIEAPCERFIAKAELERFEAVRPLGEFAPATALDALAEHVLTARSLALHSMANHLLPQIDELLFAVGKDLARQQANLDRSCSIH